MQQRIYNFDFDAYNDAFGEINGDFAEIAFKNIKLTDLDSWLNDTKAWENKMLGNGGKSNWLDGLQTGLDVVGVIPGLGELSRPKISLQKIDLLWKN